jgi:hypothetical protein
VAGTITLVRCVTRFRPSPPPSTLVKDSTREWRNGRRAGLRIRCPKGRGSSTLPSRTICPASLCPTAPTRTPRNPSCSRFAHRMGATDLRQRSREGQLAGRAGIRGTQVGRPAARTTHPGWHETTPDDTGRHVEPRSVPSGSNLRIRCPKGRGSSTLPSRTSSDLRSSLQSLSIRPLGHAFLPTLAHRMGWSNVGPWRRAPAGPTLLWPSRPNAARREKALNIYTDGSCYTSPRVGGVGYLFVCPR